MPRAIPRRELLDAVACPLCKANKGRNCIRLGGHHVAVTSGAPLTSSHPQRRDAFLKWERETHRILSEIALDEIIHGLPVKSQTTGLFGEVRTRKNNILTIVWEISGNKPLIKEEITHENSSDILEWSRYADAS